MGVQTNFSLTICGPRSVIHEIARVALIVREGYSPKHEEITLNKDLYDYIRTELGPYTTVGKRTPRSISLYSYNCRGGHGNCDHVLTLLEMYPMCYLRCNTYDEYGDCMICVARYINEKPVVQKFYYDSLYAEGAWQEYNASNADRPFQLGSSLCTSVKGDITVDIDKNVKETHYLSIWGPDDILDSLKAAFESKGIEVEHIGFHFYAPFNSCTNAMMPVLQKYMMKNPTVRIELRSVAENGIETFWSGRVCDNILDIQAFQWRGVSPYEKRHNDTFAL